MDEKKPSTADILAKIRAQKAAAAAKPPEEAAAPASPPAALAGEPAPVMSTPETAPTVTVPENNPAENTVSAAAAPPAAKPSGTKDILAAIRAQGAKGAAKAAAAPAATATTAPAGTATTAPAPKPVSSKTAVAPAGPLPSIADMVRAARKGAPIEPAEKPVLVAPPMPAKPVLARPAAKSASPNPARRSLAAVATVAMLSLGCFILSALLGSPVLFAAGMLVWGAIMTPFAAAWASLTAVAGIATLGTARFMFPNVLVEPPSRFKVGPISDYPLNTVSNKWKDQFGIWIVHTDQYEGRNLIYALSTVCTHLGCTPNWLDGEQKFKCPCHGSGFYITGVNFEGPAPRPLERVGIRIAEDGLLEVDKSLKFQEEMGQWTDASSFVDVV